MKATPGCGSMMKHADPKGVEANDLKVSAMKSSGAALKEEDLHSKYDRVLRENLANLHGVLALLNSPENEKFWSQKRRQEWSNEISVLTRKNECPETIIGCLGASGVGKSSLLNSLLNESEILPTSCSRGCTASVVELRFNQDLLNVGSESITVYRGEVELMSLQEWLAELKMLLEACCATSERSEQDRVYPKKPDESEASAAWEKINEVYGRGTMESFAGNPKEQVWDRLSKDGRIVSLLKPQDGQLANTVVVEEGSVDANKAKILVDHLPGLKGALKREKKKWAKGFRKRLNEYIYRKGNGKEPQTWPLIKKVSLYGPWAVLATGAVLVDLPGVRDANAARAKVAETYLDNCHKIWIVAPIKRAVDDKTARDLMDEQFKLRLLMDGMYGMVSFICTHSDDVETTEVLRDHEDVVKEVEGRWEALEEIQGEIDRIEQQLSELNEEEEKLRDESDEIKEDIKELKKGCAGKGHSSEALQESKDKLNQNQKSMKSLEATKQNLRSEISGLQRSLKAAAAMVRNEYSTMSLQRDFFEGLEQLYCQSDQEELGVCKDKKKQDNVIPPLPHDYQLEVHCISSNDYQKIQELKGPSDGAPSTFSRVEETQIPSLRDSVHATTASFKADFVARHTRKAADIVGCVELYARLSCEEQDSEEKCYRSAFEQETATVDEGVEPIHEEFTHEVEKEVDKFLQPALKLGASQGLSSAMATVSSWSDSACRTRAHRGPEQNALRCNTYEAASRRNGVFTSSTVGEIDLNTELWEPAETVFCMQWQSTMVSRITHFLDQAQEKITRMVQTVTRTLGQKLVDAGMQASRVIAMEDRAKESCNIEIREIFEHMKKVQSGTQKRLHRRLRGNVAQQMMRGFQDALDVEPGKGKFKRMTLALKAHCERATPMMFNQSVDKLLEEVQMLMQNHEATILGLGGIIKQKLHRVYSVSWNESDRAMDSKRKKEALECRNRVLQTLDGFYKAGDKEASDGKAGNEKNLRQEAKRNKRNIVDDDKEPPVQEKKPKLASTGTPGQQPTQASHELMLPDCTRDYASSLPVHREWALPDNAPSMAPAGMERFVL